MKKITTIMTFLSCMMLAGTAANSIEFKAGLSVNGSAYYANVKETLKDSGRVSNEEAVAAFNYGSAFIEVGSDELMGLSIGLSYAPELAQLPTETRIIQNARNNDAAGTAETVVSGIDTGTQKIDADVVDVVTLYATIPVGDSGLYGKLGILRGTLETKEVLASGSSYSNADLEALMIGAGYESSIGSTNAFWRIEGTYQQFDDVRVNGSEEGVASSGSVNRIDAELGGVNAALSIGYAF